MRPKQDVLRDPVDTASTHLTIVWRVAVPVPLFTLFDYLPASSCDSDHISPGARLQVPFGRRSRVGFLMDVAESSDFDPARLKRVDSVLDLEPLLSPSDLQLLKWAARYYHHPLGEVVATAFPGLLRRGRPAVPSPGMALSLTPEGRLAALDTLSRAPRQALLLQMLQASVGGALRESELSASFPGWRRIAAPLLAKALARFQPADIPADAPARVRPWVENEDIGPSLNPAQAEAVQSVAAALGGHASFLLEGVTGSGKTEVYLQLARLVLARGEQVMLLLPEISLTPQLEQRFRERLPAEIAVFHSKLSEGERLRSWIQAQRGEAAVLLGTRSAVFVPLKRLGLIIVDEEHDPSYKQQDGFRFSARDVAIKRARDQRIPVLLGSATPSLESLWNAAQRRYRSLQLPQRAGGAVKPSFRMLDIRQQRLTEGLSRRLIEAMTATLAARQQVLLFINRRGFAPTLICHGCGWVAECPRCDARLVIHQRDACLRCHHCAHEKALPAACPRCGISDLRPLGLGTERLEQSLRGLFPTARVTRIDRDTTSRSGSLRQELARVHDGEVDILIGTQMLAKGHHFPRVTLVGLLDTDAMLFATDFRAVERTAQLIVQVAGRAGRGDQPGTVMLQTRNPDHPLLRMLIDQGYPGFAKTALSERQAAGLPPFGHLAVWRADAFDETAPLHFLTALRQQADELNRGSVLVLGPAPAPMVRQGGRHRYQLLFQSGSRRGLHELLTVLQPRLAALSASRSVRWSVDVDPIDCY